MFSSSLLLFLNNTDVGWLAAAPQVQTSRSPEWGRWRVVTLSAHHHTPFHYRYSGIGSQIGKVHRDQTIQISRVNFVTDVDWRFVKILKCFL